MLDAFDTFRSAAEGRRLEDRGTISMRLLREALCDIAGRHGMPVELLRRHGVSLADLADDGGRISVEQYAAIWLDTAEETGDEFFCMNPRPMRVGSFAFVSRAALNCETLREAVHLALNFFSLMLDGMTGRLTEEDDVAYLTLPTSRDFQRPFTYFAYWLIIHGLMCFLVRQRIPVLAIDVVPAAPDFCADYRVLFSDEIRFGQAENRLIVASRVLDRPVRATKADRDAFLQRAPANILVKYRNDAGTVATIKSLLRSLDPDAWPDFDEVARRFDLSASTLRRRIEAEGQSFQEIKDIVRKEIAVHLLRTTTLSLSAVAGAAGFSEASSFFRAFRKWTGVNPGAYRGQGR
ncbi:AraC family transcriptional regulator [Methylobacterium aerolatum]|uniref:AraC-like DNA-binding protein n=1 Tax=Methylobacterium aerolatum TaxID=418708 RepID=A0ABU0I6W9_9HYPH|nr:AraC family transcriptional regulator [Methylobacterium aerolatum]MDQ0449847.1 AraC-like DNA-binding protein [Methylobacterium aerolatum]